MSEVSQLAIKSATSQDRSVGPLALLQRLVQGGIVPVHHQAGLPCGWNQMLLDGGDIRHTPDYTTRIHDMAIPVDDIQVRRHANGINYLMYNPLYHTGRKDNSHWNIIRCDGGEMEVVVHIAKPVDKPVNLYLSFREAAIIIPTGATSTRVQLVGCADLLNSNSPVVMKRIDSEVIVDPANYTWEINAINYGRLITGQSNIQPVWGK